MDDFEKLINASDLIEWIMETYPDWCVGDVRSIVDHVMDLPSAQPEITDEQAIEHLQSTGWMQNHDREMYESGLREQLADDSRSYDSLIPCEDTISRQAAIEAHVSTKYMNVLVACEESQRVCKEFRRLGHRAFSCDLQLPSGKHPEWHIFGDVLPLLNGDCTFQTLDGKSHKTTGKWDLIIAHPPCTYLTNGGAVRMFRREIKEFPPYGIFQMVNVERLKQGILARDFFMKFYNADCERIAIENPMPMNIYMLPKESQIIQPYMFGDPYSKKTYLWLKGLPALQPTDVLDDYHPFINGGGGRLERQNYKGQKFAEGSTERSKTFDGVARAMAEQWG